MSKGVKNKYIEIEMKVKIRKFKLYNNCYIFNNSML